MTNSKRIVTVAASLVLGTLAVSTFADSASARWDHKGRWHNDNGWHGEKARPHHNHNNYYHGYQYRPPPVVYGTPYNYGYQPPPVVYDSSPGFTIRIQ
jgi:hypothetical protein